MLGYLLFFDWCGVSTVIKTNVHYEQCRVKEHGDRAVLTSMSSGRKRTLKASGTTATSELIPPAAAPATKVEIGGGGGYTLFTDWDEGGCICPSMLKYDVYVTAPTVMLANKGGSTLFGMNDQP